MMPSEKMESCSSAPPEKRLKRPKTVPSICSKKRFTIIFFSHKVQALKTEPLFATPTNKKQAIKDGATDYLGKPFTPQHLRVTLKKVVERSALMRENENRLRGVGPAMDHVREQNGNLGGRGRIIEWAQSQAHAEPLVPVS